MTALIYRYGSICEPDMIDAFKALGLEVVEETAEMYNKKIVPSEQVAILDKDIQQHKPLFVFTINFFPAIAEVCHIYKILYLCWTVDCPVLELFSKTITYDTNRIFLFDKAQYEYFSPFNPDNIFHLPLASATKRFDKVISDPATKINYKGDISFVGSLYSEKNPLKALTNLSPNTQGFIDGLVSSALKVFGYNFISDALNQSVIDEIKKADKDFYSLPDPVTPSDRFVVAHHYIGYHSAEIERIQTLNTLGRYFKVDLFTKSDSSSLTNVNVYDGASSLIEMPQIFANSKINLNMTIKPIQTGLPLRIFDICGCGGFVMTNFQEELSEIFEIGVDLEAYTSMEELVDKCSYYLAHDDIREKIAQNGYQKAKELYSYENRIINMLRSIT